MGQQFHRRTGWNSDKSGIHSRSQPEDRDIHIFTDC